MKYTFFGIGAVGLTAAFYAVTQCGPEGIGDRPKPETGKVSVEPRSFEFALVKAAAEQVENEQSPVVAPGAPVSAPERQEDPVRRLLDDVAAGRLILDTDEEGFDVLDLSRPDAVPVIVRLWAQKHWAEASGWAKALPESEVKSASLRQIALVLTNADPAATLEWIQSLAAGAARAAAVETVATEFASAYPEQAVQLAGELPEGVNRDQTLVHIFSQWGAQDPQTAVARARAVADSVSRSRALAAVATAWAKSDPVAASTLAAKEIDDEAAQARAVVSIVQRWAQKDPGAAAAWVQKLDARDVADGAVEQLVVQWAAQDAEAPRRWLATLPNAAIRDLGLASLARTFAQSQPAQALQCATQIADPVTRQRCMTALGNR